VGRTACLDLPAFPLQLLLWRRPDWRALPAAVVESDKPQAEILWVNERARAVGVRPGMRYAAGLSLAGDLRAAPVPEAEIRKKTKAVAARLRRYTPGVEPAADDPGVFWLDASGLLPLFDSVDTWAREVLSEIETFRFAGVLVVGFSRFGAYALAKSWGDWSRKSTFSSGSKLLCQILPRSGTANGRGRAEEGRSGEISSSTVIPAQAGIHRRPGLPGRPLRSADGTTGTGANRITTLPVDPGFRRGDEGGREVSPTSPGLTFSSEPHRSSPAWAPLPPTFFDPIQRASPAPPGSTFSSGVNKGTSADIKRDASCPPQRPLRPPRGHQRPHGGRSRAPGGDATSPPGAFAEGDRTHPAAQAPGPTFSPAPVQGTSPMPPGLTFSSAPGSDSPSGILILDTPEAEHAAVRRAPLERLAIDPRPLEALRKLGVRTVGKFLELPVEGIEQRFGEEIARLHRFASGAVALPVQPERPPAPAVQRLRLEYPEADRQRLSGWIDHLLADLLVVVAGRGQALTQLHLGLACEDGGRISEALGVAAPTLDLEQIRHLVHLRLETLTLPDRVTEIALAADALPATAEQIRLFAERPRRDLEAAGRALARLRAAFGDDAVVRATLRDAHLPEASFAWEPAAAVAEPHPRAAGGEQLVRRLYARPLPLAPRERHEPDGWMLRGLDQGPVMRVLGPHILAGGWWDRPVHREYHFAETQRGEILWVYYDRPRRRWFLQGRVE